MTLDEMANVLKTNNPKNEPMCLTWMAKQFWPDADWLDKRCRNGGARRGALAAAGVAGRLAKRGVIKRTITDIGISQWVLCL